MRTVFVGRGGGQVFEGQVGFLLVVRYPSEVQEDIAWIRVPRIDTPSGARVPLEAVADIREDRGPNFIIRENGQRKIVVSANVADRYLRSVVDGVRDGVASLGDAAFILLNLPLALIGGAVGVLFSVGVLSVASIIGFIALFGIATRNGIMMVSHIRHLIEEEGVSSFRPAFLQGAKELLVPILMTAMAAGLALAPLTLRGEHSWAELEAPMAMVILFSLFSATALNMVVVPLAYFKFSRRC